MDTNKVNRRAFMKRSAAVIGAGLAGGVSEHAEAVEQEVGLSHRNERLDRMQYRKLGRTNFYSSKLIFGCGAALIGGKAVRLLDRAFEAGINYYDVGSNDYYKGAEQNLAAFAKRNRDNIWITSKGYARSSEEHVAGTDVSVAYAKSAAQYWLNLIDGSLKDLQCDFIDAYLIQGFNEPSLLRSDEMLGAFEKVKVDGHVGHVGVSTHQNAQAVVEEAISTGVCDLLMVAVTPAGWYDWKKRQMLEGTPSLRELRPVLDKARESGIGLIGMKAGRLIAPKTNAGSGDDTAFNSFYGEQLMKAPLTSHQRSYAFVVEHGLDAVNSDMGNFKHFEENLNAVRTSHTYFA